jgi:hypothetical protein
VKTFTRFGVAVSILVVIPGAHAPQRARAGYGSSVVEETDMTKLTLVAVIALAGTLISGGVAGKWTMNVDTGSAHGIMTMGLTLEQNGKDVNGTFHSPHGDVAVTGEFADGTLKLSATAGDSEMSGTFTAKLGDDGTLDGYMSTSRGEMKFTAKRAEEQK